MIFLPSKEKGVDVHSTKVQYAFAFTQFVSYCVSNASPHYLQEKSVSCMVALMSHFPIKEQDFTFLFFRFFSLYVLSFTMIFFLFNWLVSSSFFSSDLSLSEKKTQRGSLWYFSFFIFPYVLLPHSSISLFFSTLLLLPLLLDYLFLSQMRSAVVL